MRRLFSGIVLLFSVLLANTALGFYGGGNRQVAEFDTDWIWVGGEILPGSPKFKLSQHPDGYSMQIGMSGFYMRAQYSDVDKSVDFSISDYKGSVKYKLPNYRNPGDNEVTGEFTLVGGEHSGVPVDAIVKVKFQQVKSGQYASPLDPYELEITLTQKLDMGLAELAEAVNIGDELMKEMKVFDTVIKATVNPRNWAESTINFNMNTEGDLVTGRGNDSDYSDYSSFSNRRRYRYSDPYEYAEGEYNISASFMIINVVQPSSSERQPKITIALDMETNRNVPNGPNSPSYPNKKSWKKSILFDGMINLTGKGPRLGVMKVTDANTGNSIGRVQAKRADADNLRLEFFKTGSEFAAINYYEGSLGETNITLEAAVNCGGQGLRSFRLYDRIVGPSSLEQRFYKDVFYMGEPCSFMNRELEGDKGMIWEEKMSAANDYYLYNVLVSNGRTFNNLFVNLDNQGQNTKFQLGTVSKSLYMRQGTSQIRIRNSDKMELEIKPSTNEVGEYDMKVSFNNDRLFDGWFIGTKSIRSYARQHYPAAIQQSFDRLKSMHDQTIRALTEYV